MATREGFRFTVLAVAIDGADSVDHMFRCKLSAGGDDGFARRQIPDFTHYLATLGEDRGASSVVNGAVDAASAEQRRICSIHDGVGGLTGEVAGAEDLNRFAVVEIDLHTEDPSTFIAKLIIPIR